MTDKALFIHVTDREGITHTLPALKGWRVMEIIRDNGLPIKAECGGSCACATCHVFVAREWLTKVIPPQLDELEMLDTVPEFSQESSRLSCQILMCDDLNGLCLTLAPGSES